MKKNFYFPLIYWLFFIPIYFLILESACILVRRVVISLHIVSLEYIPTADLLIPEIIKCIISFIVLFLYKKYLNQTPLKQIPPKMQALVFFICLLIMLISAADLSIYHIRGIITFLKREINSIKIDDIFFKLSTSRPKFFTVCCCVLPPISEEILFRRVIYSSMKEQTNSVLIAIILSSLLFSYMHLYDVYFIEFFAIRFFLGVVLAVCYEKTNNIIFPIILHSTYNFVHYILCSGHSEYIVVRWPFNTIPVVILALICLITILVLSVIMLIERHRSAKLKVQEEATMLACHNAE